MGRPQASILHVILYRASRPYGVNATFPGLDLKTLLSVDGKETVRRLSFSAGTYKKAITT